MIGRARSRDTNRAEENREHVRELLRARYPQLAAVLEAFAQDAIKENA